MKILCTFTHPWKWVNSLKQRFSLWEWKFRQWLFEHAFFLQRASLNATGDNWRQIGNFLFLTNLESRLSLTGHCHWTTGAAAAVTPHMRTLDFLCDSSHAHCAQKISFVAGVPWKQVWPTSVQISPWPQVSFTNCWRYLESTTSTLRQISRLYIWFLWSPWKFIQKILIQNHNHQTLYICRVLYFKNLSWYQSFLGQWSIRATYIRRLPHLILSYLSLQWAIYL